jgi:hypothetical protein
MRGAPQSRFSTLICRINARTPALIGGRPPMQRDFNHPARDPGALASSRLATGAYPPVHLAPEHDQLLSERGILGFKSALGPEECGEQAQEQQNQRDHHRKRDAILSSIQYGRGFRYTPVDGGMSARVG